MTSDTRYVYSAGCTWHGPIQETVLDGIPRCPHCRSVLYEMPSREPWDESVRQHAVRSSDPGYPAFVEWLRHRENHYKTHKEARVAFDQQLDAKRAQ